MDGNLKAISKKAKRGWSQQGPDRKIDLNSRLFLAQHLKHFLGIIVGWIQFQ